jgi:predicted DCC family thiol-disulfide oxidoreductase YuxK
VVTRGPYLVYDDSCGFCTTAAMAWLRRVRHETSATLLPSSRAVTGPSAVGLSQADVDRSVWWITDGASLEGGRAVLAACAALRFPWRAVGWCIRWTPLRFVVIALYPTVARHRHRLPGATGACAITAP